MDIKRLQIDLLKVEKRLNKLGGDAGERAKKAVASSKRHNDWREFNDEVRLRVHREIRGNVQKYRDELVEKYKPLFEQDVSRIDKCPDARVSPRRRDDLIRVRRNIYERRIEREVEMRKLYAWNPEKVQHTEAMKFREEMRAKSPDRGTRGLGPTSVGRLSVAARSATMSTTLFQQSVPNSPAHNTTGVPLPLSGVAEGSSTSRHQSKIDFGDLAIESQTSMASNANNAGAVAAVRRQSIDPGMRPMTTVMRARQQYGLPSRSREDRR